MDYVYTLQELFDLDDKNSQENDNMVTLGVDENNDLVQTSFGSVLIETTPEIPYETLFWSVIFGLYRYATTQVEEKNIRVVGIEGIDGPSGVELLEWLEAVMNGRTLDEPADPIIAVFPPVDNLPEEHKSLFQTLVMKSSRMNVAIVSVASDPGLLSMLFTTKLDLHDEDGLTVTFNRDDKEVKFNLPLIKRNDISAFKRMF